MASYARRAFSSACRLFDRMNLNSANVPEIFLPPIDRSMQILNRSFFQKTVPLSAASVTDFKNISVVRASLVKSRELLQLSPIKPLRDDPDNSGKKYFLLQPHVKSSDSSTWSPTLADLVRVGHVQIRDYSLQLTYDDWTMHNILEAILPELLEEEKETPAGFAQVGHVAHVNLRAPYVPYKALIGQVLLDKNPTIETVINKTLDVGTESVFRTFPYEVLAGKDDMNVTVNESGCEFKFNFGKVYWNSRLGTEHARLCTKFREGEAICDVMAGVGPFAVPAGKQKVFVHANDLNPDSYEGLKYAISRNKVMDFVSAACEDGRSFIRRSTIELPQVRRKVAVEPKTKISRNATLEEKNSSRLKTEAQTRILQEPASFDHYVMNLPAIAVEFLDAFKGTLQGREKEFTPYTERKLPMIHVYLFQPRLSTEEEEYEEVCQKVSKNLGSEIKLGIAEQEVELYYVRLVAPKKKMYCASFRLPAAVAFA